VFLILEHLVIVLLLLLLLLQAIQPCCWQGRLAGADDRLLPQGAQGEMRPYGFTVVAKFQL
jgi:hypothetical protein